ncbi:MAG: glutamate--tRNA ligase [Phycisphaerae bacterium]|nr:glutamate--tRNA ligase [Phycisphaerae bacterium]
MNELTTRFPPSPTGYLHVGGARTALFGFVMARKTGGQFVLRIEDTDRARHDESAVDKIIEDLNWLGIKWDQGPDIGGENAPYRQSERLDIYRGYVDKLLDEGKAYYAFDTSEELDAMRTAAQEAKQNFSYPRPDPLPSAADAEQARQEGRPVVVRFLCPDGDVTINDDAFGEVTMPADQTDDFIIQKADTYPTYHLANVIDDALMGVNYIMRGQEFLGQSWRHKLLRQAMGFDEPGYCHLPLIMDVQGRKLSKRDGDVEVFAFRKAGYLPEAMVNYLALLGWNPGNDIERFSLDGLIELFTPDRVGKTNAKFDRDKLLAFNTDVVAAASEDRLLEAFKDYLSINDTPIPSDDDDLLRRILQANKGFRTFADIIAKSGILFDDESAIEYDPKAVKKWLNKGEGAGWAMLAELRQSLAACEWTIEAIEQLIADICEAKEIGMGKVAQPIRVAVAGKAVSPSIGDTLVFLGKEKTLLRIDNCLASKG